MNVLIVDDNPAEAQLTREAFVESSGDFNLTHVACGEDELDFLKHENGFSNAISPDLVLLDLNLPRKNGCEVLREINV
ncbi:response regulator [Verrucomicrobiales bacterium]|nr:response regulator [Verrucomicrobiales bacterium]MDB4657594.1 response regulator [Verrucomicrobiales bacterium]MDC0259051.1 response regulator [Verrucomicrobiales bacterium]